MTGITMTNLLWALAIFCLRICDVSMGTVRTVVIVRGWRFLASAIGFVEVTIFILVINRVLSHMDTWINVVAYSGGFAAGTFVGITIERKIAPGLVLMRVISKGIWQTVADKLRESGFGVTELSGVGREGMVMMIESVIERKQMPRFIQIVEEIDPDAFLMSEEMHAVKRGYISGAYKKK